MVAGINYMPAEDLPHEGGHRHLCVSNADGQSLSHAGCCEGGGGRPGAQQ